MQFFDNIPAAVAAVYAHHASIPQTFPEELVEELGKAIAEVSPVAKIVAYGEALYAYQDDIANTHKELAASLLSLATEMGWHGLANEANGVGKVRALRREAGHVAPSGEWPKPESDPKPRTSIRPVASKRRPETPQAQ